jgi:hypothetical protein
MNYRKQAAKLNALVFNNAIDMDKVQFSEYREFIGASGIAGITYAFKTDKKERISMVCLFSKYCKERDFTIRVLLHELVHVYQNQLKMPINHNGALMRYYIRKAKALGYNIDMRKFV